MARVLSRLIVLTVAGVNRADAISSATITSAEGEESTRRLGARAPERKYALTMRIAQDHAPGTLWDLIWHGEGTSVDGTYAPHGNATASPAQPHYDFTAAVAEPNGTLFGAEAPSSLTAVATVEVTWPLFARPTTRTA